MESERLVHACQLWSSKLSFLETVQQIPGALGLMVAIAWWQRLRQRWTSDTELIGIHRNSVGPAPMASAEHWPRERGHRTQAGRPAGPGLTSPEENTAENYDSRGNEARESEIKE